MPLLSPPRDSQSILPGMGLHDLFEDAVVNFLAHKTVEIQVFASLQHFLQKQENHTLHSRGTIMPVGSLPGDGLRRERSFPHSSRRRADPQRWMNPCVTFLTKTQNLRNSKAILFKRELKFYEILAEKSPNSYR